MPAPSKKDLEELIGQLQMNNQQLQNVMIQKQTLMIQTKEIEKALEQLEKASDDVYKSVGPILVKTPKEDIKKELAESKEDIDLKIQSLDKQEAKIKERIKKSQDMFKGMIPEEEPGEGG